MRAEGNPGVCDLIRSKLSELETSELRALPDDIRVHLNECESCLNYYTDLLRVSDGLKSLVVPSPPELYPQVMQALPVHKTILKRKMIWLLGILVLALSVLIAEYAYILYTRNQESETRGASCTTKVTTLVAPQITNTEACSRTSPPTQEQ